MRSSAAESLLLLHRRWVLMSLQLVVASTGMVIFSLGVLRRQHVWGRQIALSWGLRISKRLAPASGAGVVHVLVQDFRREEVSGCRGHRAATAQATATVSLFVGWFQPVQTSQPTVFSSHKKPAPATTSEHALLCDDGESRGWKME